MQVAKGSHRFETQSSEQNPYEMTFGVEGKSVQIILKLVSTSTDAVVGQAVIDVQHLIDAGATAFWAVASDGGVLAKRWHKNDVPWTVRPCLLCRAWVVVSYVGFCEFVVTACLLPLQNGRLLALPICWEHACLLPL